MTGRVRLAGSNLYGAVVRTLQEYLPRVCDSFFEVGMFCEKLLIICQFFPR